nr:hypothetical protein CFP56_31814 [Quercus suber]
MTWLRPVLLDSIVDVPSQDDAVHMEIDEVSGTEESSTFAVPLTALRIFPVHEHRSAVSESMQASSIAAFGNGALPSMAGG